MVLEIVKNIKNLKTETKYNNNLIYYIVILELIFSIVDGWHATRRICEPTTYIVFFLIWGCVIIWFTGGKFESKKKYKLLCPGCDNMWCAKIDIYDVYIQGDSLSMLTLVFHSIMHLFTYLLFIYFLKMLYT